jgi:hypothetical protein
MNQNIHKDHEANASDAEADLLRDTERNRLRSLVEVDMALAHQLHADDFQLITPGGSALSKEAYLGSVASGDLNYLVWNPESIDVRLHGRMAVMRYQAQIEIVVDEQKIPLGRYWHTDAYEKRDGRWQVVWSQATEIK